MKQLISAIIMVLIFSDCRKIDSWKQTSPVEFKCDTVAEKENNDDVFIDDGAFICKLPIPAEYPGGTVGWLKFLKQNLVYPEIAIDKNIQGKVIVQFTVCEDGALCDIEAISGPDELKECAVQVFKKSPKWTPSSFNGRNVKDYRKQPIIFRFEEE